MNLEVFQTVMELTNGRPKLFSLFGSAGEKWNQFVPNAVRLVLERIDDFAVLVLVIRTAIPGIECQPRTGKRSQVIHGGKLFPAITVFSVDVWHSSIIFFEIPQGHGFRFINGDFHRTCSAFQQFAGAGAGDVSSADGCNDFVAGLVGDFWKWQI